jgi:peptidoglycan L-alanyl-D-glutamate endopeptidase CwlK
MEISTSQRITEARIVSLRPIFQARVRAWLAACVAQGLRPYIYEGARTLTRQAELYAQGRTVPGRIVTQAKPGRSFHNYGLAIDWVPLIYELGGGVSAGWDEHRLYAWGADIGREFKLRALKWESGHLEDATVAGWWELAGGKG